MTPTERDQLQQRLNRAAELERRIKQLEEALIAMAGDVQAICIGSGPEYRIWFAVGRSEFSPLKGGLSHVCLSSNDPSLGQMAMVAFREIIERRLQEAKDEYAKL